MSPSRPRILLNPGPVVLSDRVRQALLRPDLCHREQEFSELQQTIRQGLIDVYQLPAATWAAVLLTGSGTAAMEAMLCSLVPERGKLLIPANGVYGERLARIADIHRIAHTVLSHAWNSAFDMARLEQAIRSDRAITHVAVVHHETTTGRLNDLAAIAALCRERDVRLLVDAISSFGAEMLRFEDWDIAGCAGTANKCLHGVPGCAFVIVDKRRLQQVAGGTRARSLYLDLNTYLRQQEQGGTPFTQSVHAFYALAEALEELAEDGGWRQRHRSYWQRLRMVRSGLRERCAIQALLPEEDCSCVLNAFQLPQWLDYAYLHDRLKESGFIIYAGQGVLADTAFRVSCMGAISTQDIQRFVTHIHRIVAPTQSDTH